MVGKGGLSSRLGKIWKGLYKKIEADAEQGCPVCGKLLYRTGVEKCFRLDPHAGPKIKYPYESAPVVFKKSRT